MGILKKNTFAFSKQFRDDFFTHLVCVMWPHYLGDNVVRATLKFRARKENYAFTLRLRYIMRLRRCFAEDDRTSYCEGKSLKDTLVRAKL